MTEDTTDMTDETSAENAAEDVATSAEEPAQSTEPNPLEKAQAEALEMKTRYLRSVADMENFRKRIAREKQDIIRSAASAVIESLLPFLIICSWACKRLKSILRQRRHHWLQNGR